MAYDLNEWIKNGFTMICHSDLQRAQNANRDARVHVQSFSGEWKTLCGKNTELGWSFDTSDEEPKDFNGCFKCQQMILKRIKILG